MFLLLRQVFLRVVTGVFVPVTGVFPPVTGVFVPMLTKIAPMFADIRGMSGAANSGKTLYLPDLQEKDRLNPAEQLVQNPER